MNPLAVQLWTVREELAKDLDGVLRQLAGFGYGAVEPFDVVSDPSGLRASLDAAGLVAPSVHGRLEQGEAVFDGARTVGADTVYVAYQPPERFATVDNVRDLAAELRAFAAAAAGRGLRAGYHNHDFELSTLLDGRTALEVLAEQADDDVLLELDIYWAATGGQDVAALLGRLGERVRALHVKDGPAVRGEPMTAVGSGRVPVESIMRSAPWVEWHIVELDQCAPGTSMMTEVQRSRDWLVAKGLAA
jgi:sugar phosphate isomerase/epimerase